jgi:hypothetical protein
VLFEELAYGAFSRLLRDAYDEAAPASHGARRKKSACRAVCLRASGLSVLLLNYCFDLDACASAAPPRGTQSGKPVARAACLPRLAREKRPTWYKNLP